MFCSVPAARSAVEHGMARARCEAEHHWESAAEAAGNKAGLWPVCRGINDVRNGGHQRPRPKNALSIGVVFSSHAASRRDILHGWNGAMVSAKRGSQPLPPDIMAGGGVDPPRSTIPAVNVDQVVESALWVGSV